MTWEDEALKRIAERRVKYGRKFSGDFLWQKLKWLQWLEEFVRASVASKQPAEPDPWIEAALLYPDDGETVLCEVAGAVVSAKFEDYQFWVNDNLVSATHWRRP